MKLIDAGDENPLQRGYVNLHIPTEAERASAPRAATEMEEVMTKQLQRWRSCRRYRSTLRALSSLTAAELRELGIRPVEIQYLAREAARTA